MRRFEENHRRLGGIIKSGEADLRAEPQGFRAEEYTHRHKCLSGVERSDRIKAAEE
jgi:hypothetical protein